MTANDERRPWGEAPTGDQAGEPIPILASHADVGHAPRPTNAERAGLAGLARKRGKVSKSVVDELASAYLADAEDQLAAEFGAEDQAWAASARLAEQRVAETNALILEVWQSWGRAAEFAPRQVVYWRGRGSNASSERRAELRRLAKARIEEGARAAKVAIDVAVLDVETALVREGLTTGAAHAFLSSMPTPEELLPPVDVTQLDPNRLGRREVPPRLAGALLTPTTGSGHEARLARFAAAVAANPDGSDRAIGRMAGLDHKTVGRLRGELPRGGESPAGSGELPTEAEGLPSETSDASAGIDEHLRATGRRWQARRVQARGGDVVSERGGEGGAL